MKYTKRTNKRSWTAEGLAVAVATSTSYRQVLSKLGLREAGGNYHQVQKYIAEYELDDSHFKGQGWSRGLTGVGQVQVPLELILRNEYYFPSHKLKLRLFKTGLKQKSCEECGWAQMADDGRIPLELDHINGDRYDNRIENLRILCPNCHSLKPTYRGRNIGKFTRARVVER